MRRVEWEQFNTIAGMRQSRLTKDDLDNGYDNSSPNADNPGTTYPTQPTLEVQGIYVGTVLEWDRQTNLTNFSHYEVRVSATGGAPWSSIAFDGTGLGTEGEVTVWPNELLVHAPLPLDGDADDPQESSWTYSVRRVTRTGRASPWSTFETANAKAAQDGTLGANSIYANNIRAGEIDASKLTVGLQADITAGASAEANANDYTDSEAESIADGLGYATYQALLDAATNGTTIIDGGYIRATLIAAAALQTMFANVSYQLTIGYYGTGTADSPQEGDVRIYLDGDEIKSEVYTDDAWSSDRRLRFGGTDTHGNFMPFFQGRGLIGDFDDAPVDDPAPADASLRLFDFDGDTEDQDGVDDWNHIFGAPKYTTDPVFGGTHAIYADGLVNSDYAGGWTTGTSCSVVFRFRQDDSDITNHGLFEFNAGNLNDSIAVSKTTYYGNPNIRVVIDKGGTETRIDTGVYSTGAWHLVAVIYDRSTNTLSVWLDDTVITANPSGTWGTPTSRGVYLTLYGTATILRYMDDLLVSPTYAISNDRILQHYQRGRPWTAAYRYEDIILTPGSGGSVRVRDTDGTYRVL